MLENLDITAVYSYIVIAQTEFWCFTLFILLLQRVSRSLSFHRPKQYSNALLMSLT